MARIRVAAATIAILLRASGVGALDPHLAVHQYAHTSWSLRSSELRAAPTSITQTTDGYLWLGTESGVLRFDGVRFVSWEPQNAVMPSRQILKLLGASDGTLWLGTSEGLAHWNGHDITVVEALQGISVPTLFESRDGTIWAGTSEGQFGVARVCAVRGLEAHCDGNRDDVGGFISTIYQDHGGDLWVGSMRGLWRWRQHKRISAPDSGLEFHSITEFDHSLLVSVNRDIDRVATDALTPAALAGIPATLKPTFLRRDRDGALWIGTQDAGLWHIDGGHSDAYTPVDGLSGSFVRDLFEDQEGDIWVATSNGLDRFRAFPVTHVSVHDGLSSDTVNSVLAARDGSIWVGTAAGLNNIRQRVVTPTPAWAHVANDLAGTLLQDRTGSLWVSSPRGVAYQRDEGFVFVNGIPPGHVLAMAQDAAGDVWISHDETGLYTARSGRVRAHTDWKALGGQPARALDWDGQGDVWMAFATGGLMRCDASLSHCIRVGTPPLGSNASFYIEPDQTVWVASQAGLVRYTNGQLVTFGAKNGLPCDGIDWVTRDRSGLFWLSTACGLVRVGAAMKTALPAAKLKTAVFDTTDGVMSRPSLGGYGPKVAVGWSGEIWFTSTNGVDVFDPARMRAGEFRPQVHVEDVVIDRVSYGAHQDVRVPSSSRDVRIEYTALELATPEKQRFLYKLDGRDRDWVDAGTRREAFYTDLPPGTYRFRVLAPISSDSLAGNSDSRLITIVPAWYQTTTFRVSLLAITLIGAWTVHRLRLRHLTTQLNLRFADRLAERTRIAQHLHDTLLQDFISISMQLHALAQRAVGPETKPRLAKILTRLSNVIDDGRRTVQGLHARNSHELFETRLAHDAEALRGDRDIVLRVVVEGRSTMINPVVADEVYYILREAVANAFKHAQPTRVDIVFDYAESEFRAMVVDNGIGLIQVDATVEGHFGLPGMRQRSGNIGASLHIWSRPTAGTTVQLIVPGGVAYTQLT